MKMFIKNNVQRMVLCLFLTMATVLLALNVGGLYNKNYEAVEPVISEETVLGVVAESSFSITYPTQTFVVVDTDVISFSGVCDVNYPITINDLPVPLAQDGSFSFDVSFASGVNTVVVSNALKTVTYEIMYNIQLITKVSPAENVTVEGGMELEVSAEALKGSTVYAVINGTNIEMTPSDNGGQFISYFGTYTIPAAAEKAVNLGAITFFASYGELSFTKIGASITINPHKSNNVTVPDGPGAVVAPQIIGNDTVNVLSPNVDHGLGRARMCTVTADYAETVPAKTADDKSDPTFTPEIKGTVDYITGSVSYDGTEYYILMSGSKIEKDKVSEYEGYVMPTNTISSYKSYKNNGYTSAVLTMNWKVPFRSELKNQTYHVGYTGRKFNVLSCTATYIDFTFSYTNACEGGFDFSDSNIVKSAEWVDIGKNGTSTLRIHLRNKGEFFGYKAYYSSDNRLVLSFNEKPTRANAVVVLDPGHGGKDCGAIAANGTYESALNLHMATMVKNNLEAAGMKVVILRTGDKAYTLDERQAMARKAGGDIFVSIHHNASNSPTLSGTEVYYYRSYSKSLASSIHSKLASTWKNIYKDDSYMASKVVAEDGGVRFYPFRVTRIEECPAVLVECGYLSNSVECSKICDSGVQTELAKAISDGIINYFKN